MGEPLIRFVNEVDGKSCRGLEDVKLAADSKELRCGFGESSTSSSDNDFTTCDSTPAPNLNGGNWSFGPRASWTTLFVEKNLDDFVRDGRAGMDFLLLCELH